MTAPDRTDVRRVQRRTLGTLAVTQVFGGVGVTAAISVNALLAKQLSGSESLAGLAQTSQVLGAALATILVARVTDRSGRRLGLAAGYLVGATGAAVSVAAGAGGAFPLLLLGALLIGSCTAAGGQIRYAASDLSLPAHRGRDLSLVVWAGTVGSVVGPNLTGPGGWLAERLGLPPLTGAYLFTVAAVLTGLTWLWVRLHPDPLLLARRLEAPDGPAHDAPTGPPSPGAGAPPAGLPGSPADRPAAAPAESGWRLVRHTPALRAAAIGMALSHAVMVSVMIMTPIHMDHGHASLQVIGLVISVHVLGMFAFSPLIGLLVDRVGPPRVLVAAGLVLLLAVLLAGTSPAGHSAGLTVGLLLLGVGWSLAQIAASTLVTAATTPRTRPLVQGSTDVLTHLTAATGGAVSGLIVGGPGFGALNAFAALCTLGVLWAASAARAASVRE